MTSYDQFPWTITSQRTMEFKNNTNNFFTNVPPYPLTVDGYEVAVSSCVFPRTVEVFGRDNSRISIFYEQTSMDAGIHSLDVNLNNIDFTNSHLQPFWLEKKWLPEDELSPAIKGGGASTIRELLDVGMSKGKLRISLWSSYDKKTNGKLLITIHGRLARLLGYINDIKISTAVKSQAEFPFVVPKIRHLFVYADIVEPTYIADKTYQVIMHAGVKTNGDSVEVVYNPNMLTYYKVNTSTLSRISITVADDLGFPINYKDVRELVHLTLHFRKRQTV